MSIIHQALKKLDGTRGGYMHQPLSVAHTGRRHDFLRRLVLAGVVSVCVLIGAVFFALTDGRVLGFIEKGLSGRVEVASPAAKSSGEVARPVKVSEAPATWSEANDNGMRLYRDGDMEAAIEAFTKAIELAPEAAQPYNNRGLSLAMLGRFEKAERDLDTALKLRPRYPAALNNYGALLERAGKTEAAISYYRKAAAEDPSYPDARLNLGIALESLGRRQEAIISYDEYLKTAKGAGTPASDVTRRVELLRTGLIFDKGR